MTLVSLESLGGRVLKLVARDCTADTELPNPVGHQGLFAIRLDAAATSPPLESGADLRLYGRNRIYHPEFGQWTTADPAGASAPVLSTEAFHGRPIAVEATAYSGSTKYVDGMNLYAAVESNPIGIATHWVCLH